MAYDIQKKMENIYFGGIPQILGRRSLRATFAIGLVSGVTGLGVGPAQAQCTGGPSTFDCAGPFAATNEQNFTGSDIAVTLDNDFSVDTSDTAGIDINSSNGANFQQLGNMSAGGTISGAANGLTIRNEGGGSIILRATGTVRGDRALEALNEASGSDVVVEAYDIIGTTTGLFLQNSGSGRTDATIFGNIEATNTTNLTTNFDGIFARGFGDTTSMRIETFGTVLGGDEGIDAANFGSGDLEVITRNTVTSLGQFGVLARSIGDGNLDIDILGDVVGQTDGVRVINGLGDSDPQQTVRPEGNIDVFVEGSVSSSTSNGVFVEQYGSGDVKMEINGDVAAAAGFYAIGFEGEGTGNVDILVRGDSSGQNFGIAAFQEGSGDIKIVSRGDTLGDNAGLYAAGSGGDISIDIFSRAESADQHGVAVFSAGNDSDTILYVQDGAVVEGGSASLAAVHGNDAQYQVIIDGTVETGTQGAFVNGSLFGLDFRTSGVDVTIGVTGRLGTAGSSTIAFSDNARDDTGLNPGSSMVVNGVLSGGVILGAGSDSVLLNATATLGGNVFFDGDAMEMDGVSALSETGTDVITINGGTRGFFADQFKNIEQLQLQGNAQITFSDRNAMIGLSNASSKLLDVQIDQGVTVFMTDDFLVRGNILNAGTIDLATQTAGVGTVLTVTAEDNGGGQYISNGGMLMIETVLNDGIVDTTDVLVVDQAFLGSDATGIIVMNSGGVGASTDLNGNGTFDIGEGILVVNALESGEFGSFELAAPVVAGAYQYFLDQTDGKSWYLHSVMNNNARVYEAAPYVLLAGMTRMPTLEQRVGQRRWNSAAGTLEPTSGGWIRIHGDRSEADLGTGTSYDINTWGLQAGFDIPVEPVEEGQWVLGLTAQLGNTSADITTMTGTGAISSESIGFGATATWYGYNDFYADLQAQVNWAEVDYSSLLDGRLASNELARSYAASIEIGRRFELDENRGLIPQAQLVWASVDAGRFTDSADNAVVVGTNERLTGRFGIAYDYEWRSANDDSMQNAYAIANILHDFSNSASVEVAGATLAGTHASTWAEIGLGGSVTRHKNTTLYGEASYRKAFGSSGGSGLAATAGLRIQW